VRDEPRPTTATLAVESPRDVHRLLEALVERLAEGRRA